MGQLTQKEAIEELRKKKRLIEQLEKERELVKQLKKEGFSDLRVCEIPDKDNEHTHDQHTVHIVLKGELIITDDKGEKIFKAGERVEFLSGTTHKSKGLDNCKMIVGIKN